jgi:hypothetical protein
MEAKMCLVSVLFSSKKHIVDGPGLIGADVDAARAKQFLLSLDGRVSRDLTVADIQFELLSLPRVAVGMFTPPSRFALSPVWW